ncbi:PaaI family thioesterase [uncultured Draconibacterium sp.]|uniref:PaaI family thioesterase n=1 Tax=uncultured Draconibacterium sp. TaxID=1573823 RepID=UPI0032170681
MRKIINPWKANPDNRHDYNCFGCSPFNEIGLQLEFWENDEELIAKWMPRKSLEGWMGVLHGGIQATLLDEIGGWIVMIKLKTAGVTAAMNVTYLKPVKVSKGQVTVRAHLVATEGRIAKISCSLFDGDNVECVKADIDYFCFPENVAKARYHYPGVDAFYE